MHFAHLHPAAASKLTEISILNFLWLVLFSGERIIQNLKKFKISTIMSKLEALQPFSDLIILYLINF